MSTLELTGPIAPYDDLAAFYDLLSPPSEYSTWIAHIERVAIAYGLRGGRVLDVACGSGHSTNPWLERGYSVVGCDRSPRMLSLAAERTGGRAALELADLRELPALGSFDLVTCLNDSLNHLLSPRDVRAALRGMASNMASGGLIVFDVNTLDTLRRAFSCSWTREYDDRLVMWRGVGPAELPPGGTTHAQLLLFGADSHGGWTRHSHELRERHYPLETIAHELHGVGLEARAVLAQRRGGIVESRNACEDDFKALFVAGRSRGLAAWALAHGHDGR